MSVLLCDNISKVYPNNTIIQNFNYNFLDKKVYGILGRSDSGKDILLDLLSAKEKASDGQIWIDGELLWENRKMIKRVCYIKKDTKFDDLITVKGLFRKMKHTYPKWDNYYAYSLCRHFGIKLSSFVKTLLQIKKNLLLGICSIASRANITIYDDPVSDVDVKDRYDFYNFLYEHQLRYPRTVIIVTDYIDEISYLFNKVLFIDKGKLINYFTKEELKNNFRYLTGKTEVLKSLISGIKIIGAEERNGILTVCVRKKLTKDETRKFQKYLITISEVPIQKIFIYLLNLRDIRVKKYDIL